MVIPTVEDVESAAKRLKNRLYPTPFAYSDVINLLVGAKVWFKHESEQKVRAFKYRGAYNRLSRLTAAEMKTGVVAFSSGNHAQGVARAARLLDMPALIVMPSDAPEVKVDGVRSDGADVHLYDRERENREEIAAEIAAARGAIVVPSFDDPMIIAGQGTCGLEFAKQVAARRQRLDHLICCTGGGGLITGIALAMSKASPTTKIWTAEPVGHDDWKRSLETGEVQTNAPGTRSECDAILTPQPGEYTWALGSKLLSGGCVVSDQHAFEAMRIAFRHLKIVLEPGGAVALAAALFHPDTIEGDAVICTISGGNADPEMFASALADFGDSV